MEACRNGDTAAFAVLLRRYKDRLYNAVYRFLGNAEDTMDVCQETLIRAYRGLDGFRGDARFYTWLYRIAMNLARNHLRDAGRRGQGRTSSLEALADSAPGVLQRAARTGQNPGDEAVGNELAEELQKALDALPEHCRMAFVLRVYEEMPYDEIAHVMDCPPGTVKSRLNQARRLLRERLQALGAL